MKRKNKIRLFWGSIVLMIALLISSQMTSASIDHEFITVTVHSGDTLWTIAQEYAPDENKDVREIIDEIKKLNNMTGGTIIAGQSIKIPQ